MKYTKTELKKAITEGNTALIHAISMEKGEKGCATTVARAAQEYLWSGEFCHSYYSCFSGGGWRSSPHSLSDEHEW